MQLKVAKLLNQILIVITVVILLLAGGSFVVLKWFAPYQKVYLVVFAVVSIALYLVFRWLESRWDKRVVTRMAKEGHIALAQIQSGSRVMAMRDSTFTNYWLYEFKARLTTPDQTSFDKTFYEKMRADTEDIPGGWVYVTYDENKPDQIFMVPNLLISHLPQLMPVIAQFEADKRLDIKYLDVYYHKGMVLRTFQETVEANRTARESE